MHFLSWMPISSNNQSEMWNCAAWHWSDQSTFKVENCNKSWETERVGDKWALFTSRSPIYNISIYTEQLWYTSDFRATWNSCIMTMRDIVNRRPEGERLPVYAYFMLWTKQHSQTLIGHELVEPNRSRQQCSQAARPKYRYLWTDRPARYVYGFSDIVRHCKCLLGLG
jgi:hypothetical protein